MAYFEDIYQIVKQKLTYKITICSGGFVVEDFKSLVYQSEQRIEVLAHKAKLEFEGEDFVVKQLQNGLLIVTGSLDSFKAVQL